MRKIKQTNKKKKISTKASASVPSYWLRPCLAFDVQLLVKLVFISVLTMIPQEFMNLTKRHGKKVYSRTSHKSVNMLMDQSIQNKLIEQTTILVQP